jgi:hypothetical protein
VVRQTGQIAPGTTLRARGPLGIPAAVIPIDDLHLLERLAQQEADRLDLEDARDALKEAEQKGTIPLRNLMRELRD